MIGTSPDLNIFSLPVRWGAHRLDLASSPAAVTRGDVDVWSIEAARGNCQQWLLTACVMEASNRAVVLLMTTPHNGPDLNAPINPYLNIKPDY